MNIESLLRDGLAEDVQRVEVADDPWPTFARREVRHRRVQRARIAAASLALVGAIGLQSGLVPTPGWAPAVAIASTNDDLIDSPIRGSLAGDSAWLEKFRGQVDDIQEFGGPGYWKVQRDKIKFLYASDVGAMRMVLAYVPMRLGLLTTPHLVWYQGPAGAAPEAMEVTSAGPADEMVTSNLAMSPDGTNVVAVVGPSGSKAEIRPGFEHTAEGRLKLETSIGGLGNTGIAEAALKPTFSPWEAVGTVEYKGDVQEVGFGGSYNAPDPTGEIQKSLVTKALGDSNFDYEQLNSIMEDAMMMAGVSLDGLLVDLRWTGTVNGQAAAMFTVQEPGHGVVAFAFHGSPDGSSHDLSMLMPAAGAADRPIAWRLRAEENGDIHTSRVIVVAPAKAASLSLEVAGQPPVDVPLDGSGKGEFSLDPDQEASVVAYRSDGSELSRSPVLPFEDRETVIGETRGTRLVP